MSAAQAPLLAVRGLRCGYGRGDVIHDVDLEVHAGETVCLIGPNGAGKTTLTRAIAGLLRVRGGTVTFDGRDIAADRTDQRVEAGMVLVPEGRGLLTTLSVEENLMMGAYVRRRDMDVAAEMDRVMTLFPVLRDRRTQVASTLSGGEQQQLAIGRALMSRPRLLILDEPSFGVAPLVVAAIFRTIRELAKAGTTILLIEQNARMALGVAHRGYVIESGRCVLGGTTAELRVSPVVREVYLGTAA